MIGELSDCNLPDHSCDLQSRFWGMVGPSWPFVLAKQWLLTDEVDAAQALPRSSSDTR